MFDVISSVRNMFLSASMKPHLLPSGNLLVPVRLHALDGTVGDGMKEIDSSDPEFASWMAEVEVAPEPQPDAALSEGRLGGDSQGITTSRRFIQPELPAALFLFHPLAPHPSRSTEVVGLPDGPYDSRCRMTEEDGTTVLLSDGLPYPLPVVGQEGDVLRLTSDSRILIEPWFPAAGDGD